MKLNELLKVLAGNKVSIVDYESDEELFYGHVSNLSKELDNFENYEIINIWPSRRDEFLIIDVKEVK